jgi:hypothetical protein
MIFLLPIRCHNSSQTNSPASSDEMENATDLPTRPYTVLMACCIQTRPYRFHERQGCNTAVKFFKSHHWYSNFSHRSDFICSVHTLGIIRRLAGKINVFIIRKRVWNAEELRILFLLLLVGRKTNVYSKWPTVLTSERKMKSEYCLGLSCYVTGL